MRLLFLGFDALDGRRCLQDGGIFSRWDGLRCICEPEIASTGPSWTTIYTGLKQAEHGVKDCWGRPSKGHTVRDLRCLWDDLGLRCGLIGLPVTWPAWALDGWMVSGIPAPIMDERGRWPQDLNTRNYVIDYTNAVMPTGPEPVLWRGKARSIGEAWDVMKTTAWSHAQTAAQLYAADRVEALFIGFTFPDRFGHTAEGFGSLHGDATWGGVDELAHRITDLFVRYLKPDVAALVSDHGFDDNGHTPNGIFLLAGQGVESRTGRCNNWDVKRLVLEAVNSCVSES